MGESRLSNHIMKSRHSSSGYQNEKKILKINSNLKVLQSCNLIVSAKMVTLLVMFITGKKSGRRRSRNSEEISQAVGGSREKTERGKGCTGVPPKSCRFFRGKTWQEICERQVRRQPLSLCSSIWEDVKIEVVVNLLQQ